MINPEDFGAVKAEVKIDPAQFGAMANIDEERGAPSSVRNAVGAARSPEDKLATLQMYYPDSKPWGTDNFIFKDPETGNMTLYNPKGLDMGDVSEQARSIFEFIGGSIGGTGALIAGQLGPQIAAPEEIITVPLATGAGAAAGGKIYDIMTDLFTPHIDQRGFLEQSAEMSTDVLANAIGVRAGELLEGAVKTTVSKGAATAKASADEIYKAFKAMGAKPTAGAVSGSKSIQGIEQALSKLPASADMIGDKYVKLLDDMGKYSERVARSVSVKSSREEAGISIKRGLDSFVNKFKAQGKELYDEVDKYIPGNTRVQTHTFNSALQKLSKRFADDPEYAEILEKPLIKKLSKAADASAGRGGMSYNTLKAIRTEIGNAINQPQLLADTSRADLNMLYGALSDDMLRIASGIGGHKWGDLIVLDNKALNAAVRANNYWKAGRSRIDNILEPVVSKKLNHEIYNAAILGAKHSGQKLRAIKSSVPKDDWDSLVATQIREMGRAKSIGQDITGEAFSPSTFFTNYTNLSKSAKKVLFSGERYKGLEEAINNLAVTSSALKDLSKMANTSGTAQQLMYMQLLTGSFGGIGGAMSYESGESPVEGALKGAAFGMASPWVVAKLMTSPKFINWLAEGGSAAVTKNGIGAHLGRLVTIAEKDSDLAPAIYEYFRTIKGPSDVERSN